MLFLVSFLGNRQYCDIILSDTNTRPPKLWYNQRTHSPCVSLLLYQLQRSQIPLLAEVVSFMLFLLGRTCYSIITIVIETLVVVVRNATNNKKGIRGCDAVIIINNNK